MVDFSWWLCACLSLLAACEHLEWQCFIHPSTALSILSLAFSDMPYHGPFTFFKSWNTLTFAKSLQSSLTFYDPVDCSLSGSSVHGTLQPRKLQWVAMPFSRGCFPPRDQNLISYVSYFGREVFYHYHHLGSSHPHPTLAGGFFTTEPSGKPKMLKAWLIWLMWFKKYLPFCTNYAMIIVASI